MTATVAQALAALRSAKVQRTLDPALRDRPAGFVPALAPDPGDTSGNAQFWRQRGKVADALAKALVAQLPAGATDYQHTSHVSGAQGAISRLILCTVLNVDYPKLQSRGWKSFLTDVLAVPLVGWDNGIGPFKSWLWPSDPSRGEFLPLPIQRHSPDTWSVHPAYFAFWFWNDALSLYRFVQWDANLGFVFNDAFALKLIQAFPHAYWGWFTAGTWATYAPGKLAGSFYPGTQIAAAFSKSVFGLGPDPAGASAIDPAAWYYIPNPGNAGTGNDSRTGGDYSQIGYDGFELSDQRSEWICQPWQTIPWDIGDKFASAGNAQYSAQAHQFLAGSLALLASFVGFIAGVEAIGSSGWTTQNSVQLLYAVNSFPGVQVPGVSTALAAGKLFDLPALLDNMGVAITEPVADTAVIPAPIAPIPVNIPAPDIPAIPAPVINVGVPPMSSPDPVPIDTSTLVPIDTSTFDFSNVQPDLSNLGIDQATLQADLSAQMSADLAANAPSAADMAVTGTDTSTLDSILNAASNMSFSQFVSTAANAYKLVTAAINGGHAAPGVANRPAPGQVIRLRDGSLARTNADGSTTVTHPDGTMQTILPSGRVIAGGAPSGLPVTALLIGGAILIGALALSRRR